jgi:radical SAM-linked protein
MTAQTYVRIQFGKTGNARYLSHHNLMAVWERAFRRAKVQIAFSAGFSPRPILHFGPPIPVGYDAPNELLDIRLEGDIDTDATAVELNEHLPTGITVSAVTKLSGKPKSLMSSAHSGVYFVLLRNPSPNLTDQIASFLSLHELKIEISRGERTRILDVRGAVLELEAQSGEAMTMTLRLGENASCRPDDVLAAMLLEAHQVTRTAVIYDLE